MKNKFIWKRKHVTEAVYNQRLRQQIVGKRRRKRNESPKLCIGGGRIVDIEALGKS